ncbi:MAG: BrnT family toxin [Gemmatimonadaceae bacterium]|nr:BrnT family toxin [Gloeobacterales cyanobacterium ES-bin-141]
MPPEFDWDDANTAHIARHNLTPIPVEEALDDPLGLVGQARVVDGERRWVTLGSTRTGLVLRVVFTYRSGRVRVVTAYRATPAQRRLYLTR